MEGTCKSESCKLFDLLGGTIEQCPNFVQSMWTPKEGGQPVLVKDCAPIRTMLMVQQLMNQQIGLQQAQEQQRNESHSIISMVKEAVEKKIQQKENVFIDVKEVTE